MAVVRVFHSHIEVTPYKKGDCPQLEKMYSKWESYGNPNYGKGKIGHKLIPVAFYIQDDTLYLPRGTKTTMLQQWFQTEPIIERTCDPYSRIKTGVGLLKPKSKMQDEAIQFLTSANNFAYSARFSQLGLNLATGDGKTYAAICAVLKLKIRTMIIVHKDDLKDQWLETLEEKTSLPKDRICVLTRQDIDDILDGKHEAKDIYITTHQLLNAYARDNDWLDIREMFRRLKIGIRVIDEAHRFFHNVLMTDYFSNCYKTFYLTATFGRAITSGEKVIYERAFASLVRFGEQTLNYEEKRKHIIFVPVYFKSTPIDGYIPKIETTKGFSNYLYIDYELKKSTTLMKVIHRILDNTSNLEGKTLIISPKIESVEAIARNIERTYGECGVIHSQIPKDMKENEKAKGYLSSTIKSLGEGSDISKLRCIINLEQVASGILADQVAGRLREYDEESNTYIFYPVDLNIPKCATFLKNILPVMRKKCKDVIIMKMLDL